MSIELVEIAVVAVLAGAIASISGFGIGSLLTPLLALRFDLQLAVAAVSIPHFVATAYRFSLIRQDLNKEVFVNFGIWSAVGGLAGGLIGAFIQDRILTIVFALLLILAGLTGILGLSERMSFSKRLSWVAGCISGLFGGLAGNQGGIRSAALMRFNLSKVEFVATATGVGLLVDIARMPVYFYFRFADLLSVWLPILTATAGVIVGTWLGQRVLKKIPEHIFKKIVCAVILVLGIGMLLNCNQNFHIPSQ